MAGYSGTPLDRKLGIKPGQRVLLQGAPDGFVGGTLALPDDVELVDAGPIDLAVVFVTARAQLEATWAAVTAAMTPAAGFWVAWPKRASKVPTDMTEDVVRDIALRTELVD